MSEKSNVAMMRLMMGEKISDLLDVPKVDQKEIDKLGKRIRRIARIMEFLDHSLVMAMVLQFFTKTVSQMMLNKMTKSKVVNFYIPKSLKIDWINSKR
jgi:hypothetical protein